MKPTKQEKLEYLNKQLGMSKKKLLKAGKRKGEAGGEENDWHDNSAYDNACVDYDVRAGMVVQIEEEIRNLTLYQEQ